MAEQNQAQLQSSTEMVRMDVTLLAAQTRSWAGALFRSLARNDKDPQVAYSNFIEVFWQLYTIIKQNAEQTGKIADWPTKKLTYDRIFVKVIQGEFMPAAMLQVYDEFCSDMRKCGIYDLSAGEYQGLSG